MRIFIVIVFVACSLFGCDAQPETKKAEGTSSVSAIQPQQKAPPQNPVPPQASRAQTEPAPPPASASAPTDQSAGLTLSSSTECRDQIDLLSKSINREFNACQDGIKAYQACVDNLQAKNSEHSGKFAVAGAIVEGIGIPFGAFIGAATGALTEESLVKACGGSKEPACDKNVIGRRLANELKIPALCAY